MDYLKWYARSGLTIALGFFMISMPVILSLDILNGWLWWTTLVIVGIIGLLSGVLAFFALLSGERIHLPSDDYDWFLGTLTHVGLHTYLGVAIFICRYAWIGMHT